ncbi:MAG: DMT family transporter [Bosea sp. (in: a-proteobacteria)]|uniref:DMT family transporter n=1 Tax=Bosea sp. (in: a-proteobacteria) TaxID=1871050 RepID=UPI0027333027|nr:DMT family transporter [Bosea sp. (in: a-proteobacteria)]MDP3254915.1 DMT family transporter [Bosea sp. (in: a-proteobacteria)]MDP3321532.1 DMT family transporter [Bosea sp. (in: a-proteobacteria)]
MSEDDAGARAIVLMPDEVPREPVAVPFAVEVSADNLAAAASILAATALPAAANALPAARPTPLVRARGWWRAATPNLRGSLLMIAAFTAFAVMMTLIKLAGGRIPLPQILIVRQLVMTLILAFVVGRALPRIMQTSRPGLQLLRGMFSLGAMLCGFTALIHLPMAEATALGFAQVLFVTLLAILILREVVDRRRWIALAIGFAGVFVMLRPGGEAMNGYALLAILGALFGAGITISVRVLGQSERTETILFWQGAVVLIALGAPAVFLWTPPTPTEWALMIGIGVVGTAGQWLVTRAYQMGEASALAPLDFVRLLLATLSGYLVFAELPNLVTIVGAALVAGGTIYTMRHNAGARRLAAAPLPDNPPP